MIAEAFAWTIWYVPMKRTPPVNPFDPARYIGTVSEVGPSYANAIVSERGSDAAEVGAFVAIDCEEWVLFGRLTSVGSARQVTRQAASDHGSAAQPMGTIELLATVALDGAGAIRGIARFPHLGSRIYLAPPELLKWLFECSQSGLIDSEPITLNLASLADGTGIGLAPERLFGRHCAILGATGTGKSWTLARLTEEAARYSAKIILFDSTGEFHTLSSGVRHVHIGSDPLGQESSDEVAMPYHSLTESDLFALFRPTGSTQPPKLRAAVKSLKLVKVPHLATGDVIIKAGRLKLPYELAAAARARELADPRVNFDITKLPAQIDAECVFPTGGFASSPDPRHWGMPNEIERNNCVNLITRIEDMLNATELACVFQPRNKKAVFDEIDSFIADRDARVLRISLKHLPFVHDVREIIANAVGRHVLELARSGKLGNRPLLLFLDEAHHFLNKRLADEDTGYRLDSFEQIAKEGRKVSLNICIATQRPRDIPEGVLSQIGTFIVHRLSNHKDREAVESASSEADRTVMEFVPALREGQAVVIGADVPIPLAVQITKPTQQPDSRGPDYQTQWR